MKEDKNKQALSLQGGDNELRSDFYQSVFKYIKDGDRVLNLGCGKVFAFEKKLKQNKRVVLTSIDVVGVEKKPDFLDIFLEKNVEEEIKLEVLYDVVTFFEVAEHIDKTDVLIENCFNNLKDGGILIFSFPNLSSIWARLELLLGFQPHILEVSNVSVTFGTGFFGKINRGNSQTPLHHIRGITYKAMKEMIMFYGFKIKKTFGWEHRFPIIFYLFPSLAPINIFICQKLKK